MNKRGSKERRVVKIMVRGEHEKDSLSWPISWRREKEREREARRITWEKMREKRVEGMGGGGERKRECIRFVGCVDASGIIYDVQRQYVSEITIGPLLSAIKNTFSTFIRQINLDPMECDPPLSSPTSSVNPRCHR